MPHAVGKENREWHKLTNEANKEKEKREWG
jgi:hypothetical protein